ncbi:MAG: hypothetical protein IIB88_01150 [Chloroflexi bacterium]|nr:hypothetical protein [Chloroflexota bacterium]
MHITRGGSKHFKSLARPRMLSLAGLLLLIVGLLTASPPTANASSGWELILDRPTPSFGGMDFVSQDEGWLVAGAGLLHTTDGGATWEEQAKLRGDDVSFADPRHGWFVGYTGQIFATTDGGDTWVEQERVSAGLSEVIALSPTHAVAVGVSRNFGDLFGIELPSTLAHTSDGGATWTELEFPRGSKFSEIEFAGDLGWAAGSICLEFSDHCENSEAALLRTADKGATWDSVDLDEAVGGVSSLRFVSGTVGFARVSFCDDEGRNCESSVSRTEDGGLTWIAISVPTNVTDFAFVDALTGWAVTVDCNSYPDCEVELHATTDGGETWTATAIGSFPTRSATIHAAPDSLFLYLPQRILRSQDAGRNWQEIAHPALSLVSIEFGDREVGYALGGPGDFLRMFRTTDAGRTWLPLPDAPGARPVGGIQALDFLDSSTGFAAGQECSGAGCEATVWKTQDGGTSWHQVLGEPVDGPNTASFEFVSADEGLLAAQGGLFITSDGGESWRRSSLLNEGDRIQQAVYASPGTIWTSIRRYEPEGPGFPLETLLSTDGGNNWEVVLRSDDDFPRLFDFVDSMQGVLFGTLCPPGVERFDPDLCDVGPLFTRDGGSSLIPSEGARFTPERGFPRANHSVFMLDDSTGWAFAHSRLLGTLDGGASWEPGPSFEPGAGSLEFVDPENGWLLLRPGQQLSLGSPPPNRVLLYHTTDGGGGPIGVPPTPTIQLPKVGTAVPNGGSNLLSFTLVVGGLALSLSAAAVAVARRRRRA